MGTEEDLIESVIDSAKYLRDVRPLDPAELSDYVPGGTEPDRVRTILREHAYALAVRERDDGRFVPVDDGPISPTFDGVDRFPEEYEAVIRAAIVTRYGEDWYDGAPGDELRQAIRTFKARYFADEPVSYDAETVLGYALYHAPVYYASTQYVLDALGRQRLLPSRLRVLDIGAGVGGPALGLHDYIGETAPVAYHAVEPSPATELLEQLLAETGANFSWEITADRIEAHEPGDEFDLILCANVLSELSDPVATLSRLRDALAPDGTVVSIAPADRRTSLHLRSVERSLVDDQKRYTIFAPTLRLWSNATPADECWSFDERPPIGTPEMQRLLDNGRRSTTADRDPATGEFVHREPRFSYALLRTDGTQRFAVRADRSQFVPFAESDQHVTNRVDVMAVKLSHSLAEPDDNPLFRIGDGSQTTAHFAVLTGETALNAALREARYSDVIVIRNGLLLWNDTEGAYNVVVDDETLVDAVGT